MKAVITADIISAILLPLELRITRNTENGKKFVWLAYHFRSLFTNRTAGAAVNVKQFFSFGCFILYDSPFNEKYFVL